MKFDFSSTFIFLLFFISASAQEKQEIIINDDLKIIQLTENTYQHISNLEFEDGSKYPCNGLIYINNGECLIADTPPYDELSKDLINWLKENKKVKVVAIVATHWHNDCAGGLEEFHKQNIPSYSLKFTCDTLKQQNLPYSQNVFIDSTQIKVGNKFAKLFYLGPGHVKDNIVVWIEEEKVLFGGCLVKEFNSKSLGYIQDANINLWDDTLLKLKNKFIGAKIIIPGHGKHGGLELIDKSIQLVLDYQNNNN